MCSFYVELRKEEEEGGLSWESLMGRRYAVFVCFCARLVFVGV